MGMLLFYLLLSLGVSFLCSLLEAALLSVSMSHVMLMVERRSKAGRILQDMKQRIDRPLAAILSLNTIAHTVGAAGVGAEAARLYGEQWVGWISAALTLLILLLSEIIPKSLGARYARRLGPFTAYTVRLLIWGLLPLVFVCQVVSSWLSRGGTHGKVSRDEVRILAKIGHSQGAIDQHEARTIQNLIGLRERTVEQVMTPREVVFWLDADRTIGAVLDTDRTPHFARIPIAKGSLDRVVGLIHRYELFEAEDDNNHEMTLAELARPVHTVGRHTDLAKALTQMIEKQEQLFIVADDAGGTAGIVTLEDVLETMLGVEIVDETDPAVDMREVAAKLRTHRQALRRR